MKTAKPDSDKPLNASRNAPGPVLGRPDAQKAPKRPESATDAPRAVGTLLGEFGTGKATRCGQCAHFLAYKPSEVVNHERKDYGGWCRELGVSTCPELLRCGGGDFKRREDPFKEDQ